MLNQSIAPLTMKKNRHIIIQFIILIGFLFFWELSVKQSQKSLFLYGSPSLIYKAFIDSWTTNRIYIDLLYTFSTTIIGFLIGNIVGIVLGLSMAFSSLLSKISKPFIIALGAIPIFSIAPMMIIWFGTGFFAKVYMVIFSTFLITTLQAYTGATSIDKKYKDLFKSLNATDKHFFWYVKIPNSIIWVLTSFKLTIGFALLGAFIGEFISSEKGLGHLIIKYGSLYNIPMVFVGLIHIVGIALILNILIGILEKRMLKWKIQ